MWRTATAVYRPTVHYAYLPTDVAMASLHECRMSGYELQDAKRIMTDEITEGMDELGVLLLGHDLNGWWVGSQLDIDEARELVPHQNATTLQVAASILGRGLLDDRASRPRACACPTTSTTRPCSRSPTPTSARARRCRPTGARRRPTSTRWPTSARRANPTPWSFAEFLVR